MGQSIAQFFLRGATAEWVLSRAQSFAMAEGLRVEPVSQVQVVLKRGSIWWTGVRVIIVEAWPAQGGANVQIRAYAQTLMEMNADPRGVLGFIPRRDTWRLVSTFVSQLGVSPESVFRHS